MSVQFTAGVADGWSVFQHPLTKQWQWSAYGSNGGAHGLARTQGEACERAQKAAADMRRPWKKEDS